MKKGCNANSGHAKKPYAIVKGFNSDGSGRSKIGNAPENLAQRSKSKTSTQKHSAVTLFRPSEVLLQDFTSNRSSESHDMSASNPNRSIAAVRKNDRKVIAEKSAKMVSTKADVGQTSSRSSSKDTSDDTDAKDARNHHLYKLRDQFSGMHDAANQKMLELQTELGKMQHMSHEFDVLAEFLSSEERPSVFEQNFDCLQKTVLLTEEKIHQIHTNYHKMGRMMRQVNETARKQNENTAMAINAIGEKLTRCETKLDRMVRKITNPKIDDRLTESSADMETMKIVIVIIISVTVLILNVKMYVDRFR